MPLSHNSTVSLPTEKLKSRGSCCSCTVWSHAAIEDPSVKHIWGRVGCQACISCIQLTYLPHYYQLHASTWVYSNIMLAARPPCFKVTYANFQLPPSVCLPSSRLNGALGAVCLPWKKTVLWTFWTFMQSTFRSYVQIWSHVMNT